MAETRNLEVGWGTLWRIFAFALVVFVLFEARAIVGALFISIVISIGLDPFVSFLERYKLPRIVGTLLAFLAGFLALGLIAYSIMPAVAAEFNNFAIFVNAAITSFLKLNIPQFSLSSLPTNLGDALNLLGSASVSVGGVAQTIFSNVLLLFAAVVASFYLTIAKDGPERFLESVVAHTHREAVLRIFNNFKEKIRKWFFAQLLLSVIVTAMVSSGLWLIGVPYALAIGIVAGVLELVPMVGPVIAGVIGVLVALAESAPLALYTFIFFILIQQLDGNVLIPYIMGRTMRVHPLVVMLSLLIGWSIAGLTGIILAVPSAVLAEEVFGYIASERNGSTK